MVIPEGPPDTATIIVAVDHRCNNRCGFCSQADLPPAAMPVDIPDRLERAYASGVRRVEFVGGEPTLHDELTNWIAAARRLGFECIGVQTNGRRLAYPAYTAKLTAAGLTHADVSLHGSTAAVHEFHTTVPGSYQQTIAGLRRARAARVTTAITTVVTRSNVHDLPALAHLVAALHIQRWRVILAQAIGRAAADARRLIPRWQTAARYLVEARRVASAHSCRIVVGGLPPCIEPAFPRWVDRDMPSAFAEPCARCGIRPACPGVDPGYLALYGHGELRPVTGPIEASDGQSAADLLPEETSAFVGGLGRTARG